MRLRNRFREWAGRGVIILATGAFFAYTVIAGVSSTVSTLGGVALILGLYFGLGEWSAFTSVRRKQAARRPS
jgi:hypothetical protein